MSSKRILVPLDGSAESNAALPLARTLAGAIGASVTLLRALSSDDDEVKRYAQSNLTRIADELRSGGLSVNTLLRFGEPAEQIAEELQTEPTEMVVLRTHGRVGLERTLLGSVTQRLLKQTAVPLVLMRPGERRIAHIEKLLVPVDGSPGGAFALGAAVPLARATGATISLVQVTVPIAIQTALAYEYDSMGYYDPAWDDEALASAKDYVERLAGRLRSQGLSVNGEAFMGPSVVQGICAVAERDAIDLVIMSTHALTGPARALLGSVADAVVRTAPCPVLLVHRVESAEEEQEEPPATIGTPAAVRS